MEFNSTSLISTMPSLGVCMVATKDYLEKWYKVALDLENTNFVNFNKITIHLFTDKTSEANAWGKKNFKRVNLITHQIFSWGWPEATLLRYKFFSDNKELFQEDILMYLDSDMRVVNDFSTKLNYDKWTIGIALVVHPGFFRNKGFRGVLDYFSNPKLLFPLIHRILTWSKGYGTWETNKISSAFVPKHLRRKYFHGAVWFGYRKQFLNMCEQLSLNVNSDLAFEYIAVWHDESHLNKYAAYNNVYSLGPEFSGVNKYRNLKNFEFLIITEEKRFGEGRAPTSFSAINAK